MALQVGVIRIWATRILVIPNAEDLNVAPQNVVILIEVPVGIHVVPILVPVPDAQSVGSHEVVRRVFLIPLGVLVVVRGLAVAEAQAGL